MTYREPVCSWSHKRINFVFPLSLILNIKSVIWKKQISVCGFEGMGDFTCFMLLHNTTSACPELHANGSIRILFFIAFYLDMFLWRRRTKNGRFLSKCMLLNSVTIFKNFRCNFFMIKTDLLPCITLINSVDQKQVDHSPVKRLH